MVKESSDIILPRSKNKPSVAELHLKEMDEERLIESMLWFGKDWSEQEQAMVMDASRIVSEIFNGDKYKQDPYTYHLLRVANRVVGYLEIPDWELAVAALHHDTREDHPREFILAASDSPRDVDLSRVDIQKCASHLLEVRYSQRVARSVDAVTNPPTLSKKNYDTTDMFLDAYEDKVREAVKTSEGWVLKFSDWCDNGLGLYLSDFEPKKIALLDDKYSRSMRHLERRYYSPDIQSMLTPNAYSYVEQQFSYGHERLKAA